METIASFTIDHIRMKRGIFLSRQDRVGQECISTFDVRLKEPNREPVMTIAPLHTMEHLGATFLRNHPLWASKTIYFGPMGCRTGFYVLFNEDLASSDVIEIITELFTFMAEFEGEIPGATAKECGNYLDQNLPMAKWEAKRFLEEVLLSLKEENLTYPK